jgi:hypothetical protein
MEHGLSKVVGVVMFHGVLGAQGLLEVLLSTSGGCAVEVNGCWTLKLPSENRLWPGLGFSGHGR